MNTMINIYTYNFVNCFLILSKDKTLSTYTEMRKLYTEKKVCYVFSQVAVYPIIQWKIEFTLIQLNLYMSRSKLWYMYNQIYTEFRDFCLLKESCFECVDQKLDFKWHSGLFESL